MSARDEPDEAVVLALDNFAQAIRRRGASVALVAPNSVADGIDETAARLRAHAAIAAAIADARREALAEVDAAADRMADQDDRAMVTAWRIAPDHWRCEITDASATAVGVGTTLTGAMIDLDDMGGLYPAAAALDAATEGDRP